MGLLRRAATATDTGTVSSGRPGTASGAGARPRGPGLLRRSLKARAGLDSPQPVSPTDQEPLLKEPVATPRSLAIELAGEEPVVIQIPARVEADRPAPAPPEETTAGPSFRKLSEVTEEVETAISSLRPGMELPSRLFTAVGSLLGIRKGAFLLYDALRMVYAPWAQRGYDQTTRHRMRIPLGANEPWNALANGKPLLLTGAPTLAVFQSYFSSREFSSVERLILVPFISDEKLAAVFLITDMDSPFSTPEELLECLQRASEIGSPRVQEARASRFAEPLSAGAAGDAPPADDLAHFLASLSGRSTVQLVALSLEDFSRHILRAHEDLDPFRLHEDIQFFLGSFLADTGRALPVRPGRFTLALADFDGTNLDLVAHQLTMFLNGLFGNGAPGPGALPGGRAVDQSVPPGDAPASPTGAEATSPQARILRTASWPADGPDLRVLVESLSS